MSVVVIPVGSFEQHGPHLPSDTDTRIANHLARELVRSLPDMMLGPAITVSSSGEHNGFANTLSIGNDAVTQIVVEMIRSADWSDGVVLVNGHGGNLQAITKAMEVTAYEKRRAMSWWPQVPGGDAHAGHTETSIMLAIAPDQVDLARAEIGNTQPMSSILPQIIAGGIAAVSPNGVLGDPSGSSVEAGNEILKMLLNDLVAAVKNWMR